jgi:hypothetical protein
VYPTTTATVCPAAAVTGSTNAATARDPAWLSVAGTFAPLAVTATDPAFARASRSRATVVSRTDGSPPGHGEERPPVGFLGTTLA